jgi:hypothetical protein
LLLLLTPAPLSIAMPTLIDCEFDETNDDGAIQETARDSDIAWLRREFRAESDSETGDEDNNNNNNQHDVANDSTLSGSFLVAALADFRATQRVTRFGSTSPPTNSAPRLSQIHTPSVYSSASTTTPLDGKKAPSSEASHTVQLLTGTATTTTTYIQDDSNAGQPARRRPLASLPAGPNQLAYQKRYQSVVHRAMDEMRRCDPDGLPRNYYATLTTSQQRREQERVVALLARLPQLSISSRSVPQLPPDGAPTPTSRALSSHEMPTHAQYPMSEQASAVVDFLDHSEVLLSPAERLHRLQEAKLPSCACAPTTAPLVRAPHQDQDVTMETSVALLSPPPAASLDAVSSSDSSTSSVEVSRAARPFQSPPIHSHSSHHDHTDEMAERRKRLATTSGKRGADTSRFRRDGMPRHDDDADNTLLLPPSPGVASPAPPVFSASQSPIFFTHASSSDETEDWPRRLNSEEDSSVSSMGQADTMSSGDDLPEPGKEDYVNETIEESVVATDEVNRHWGLPKHTAVHFAALPTTRRRPRALAPTQSFADPLDLYSGRPYEKMKATYRWIRRHLESSDVPAAVVFGLPERNLRDLCLRLTLRRKKNPVMSSSFSQSSRAVKGQTLVVVRELESLVDWKRTFREGSDVGVLCHCDLPVKERRSIATAQRCAKYGVVLTTFNALSSADVTLTVDETGVAHLPGSQEQGWLQGRGSSQQSDQNLQKLSVLHCLRWTRVVFVDTLGRKSFVAKPNTSRNKAATLLAADARMIIFAKEADSPSGFSELVQSDKKALLGVASVLHTDVENVKGDSSSGVTFDYAHAARIRTGSNRKVA